MPRDPDGDLGFSTSPILNGDGERGRTVAQNQAADAAANAANRAAAIAEMDKIIKGRDADSNPSVMIDDRYEAIQQAKKFREDLDKAFDAAAYERAAKQREADALAAALASQEAKRREAERLAALSANAGGGNAQPYYPPDFTNPPPPAIKTATPQFVLFNDDEVPIDAMVDLLFENIGGQELLSIARADTVNGQKILYQPIKNLNILKEEYNPNNIIRLQNTSDKLFSNFSIKLADKIPNVGNGFYYSSGNKVYDGTTVYLDDDGNLVIELVNILEGEQAEIEITSSGIINEVGI
jgi:hypothetical protein